MFVKDLHVGDLFSFAGRTYVKVQAVHGEEICLRVQFTDQNEPKSFIINEDGNAAVCLTPGDFFGKMLFITQQVDLVENIFMVALED